MMSMFKDPERVRVSAKITTNYIPKTLKFQQFYIYKYLSTYNNLDTATKKKSNTSFKKEIKSILRYRPISDTMD